MLNAIEPESVVPIHRHQKTSETVVVLRGRVVEEYYDDEGSLVESGTVILEVKDGAYEPLQEGDVLR